MRNKLFRKVQRSRAICRSWFSHLVTDGDRLDLHPPAGSRPSNLQRDNGKNRIPLDTSITRREAKCRHQLATTYPGPDGKAAGEAGARQAGRCRGHGPHRCSARRAAADDDYSLHLGELNLRNKIINAARVSPLLALAAACSADRGAAEEATLLPIPIIFYRFTYVSTPFKRLSKMLDGA